MNIGSTPCDERVLQHVISQPASDPGNKPRRVLAGFFYVWRLPQSSETPFYLFMSTTCTGGQDIHNRATGEVLRALLR
jgi:hypothetical protein